MTNSENHPKEWDFSFDLRSEHVWNGISYLALLEHYEREQGTLIVPHVADEKDRLSVPIASRNKQFDDHGQPEWAHYCEKCIRFTKFDDTGEPIGAYICTTYFSILLILYLEMVRAIVSDGVTIGHPCCSVAHCAEPLLNVKRDRFCKGHQYRHTVCAVDECENNIAAGYLTCDDPTHRQLEEKRQLRNAANFQMRAQLQRTSVSNPPDEDLTESLQADGEPLDEGIEEGMTVDVEVNLCPQKPESGNRKVIARFGRRQTHNEQLMVRPCGMIIARATFFGSETVPQTVVSIIIFSFQYADIIQHTRHS